MATNEEEAPTTPVPEPSTAQKIMWNVIPNMAPFLDPHQILRLIDFQLNFVDPPIFDVQDLNQKKLQILKGLDMVDYTWEMECQIRRLPERTEMPAEYQDKYESVMQRLVHYEAEYDDVRCKMRDAAAEFEKERDNNRQWTILKEEHGFTEDDLDTIFKYGKLKYATGDYEQSENILYVYGILAPYDHPKHLSALWGKFSSEILGDKWEEAGGVNGTMVQIRESIDKSNDGRSPLTLLQWRSWLLHWSLFVFFNEESMSPAKQSKTTEDIINLFMNSDDYRNAMETICPWLLRYLAVIIVTSKTLDKKSKRLEDLIKLIEQEHYNYSDPITEFLLCLNVHYDFEKAQTRLMQSREVLRSDYFLHQYVEDFIENGRILFFEMFCRIHQKIKIETIADKLNMTQEDAELWIVELIRNARLHAKIDSENGNIIMGSDPVVPYQQIITKTNHLALTTQMLIKNLDRKMKPQQEIGKMPAWARDRTDNKAKFN